MMRSMRGRRGCMFEEFVLCGFVDVWAWHLEELGWDQWVARTMEAVSCIYRERRCGVQ